MDIANLKKQKINTKLDGSYLFKIAKLLESHEPKETYSLFKHKDNRDFIIISELKKMDFYSDYIDYEFDLSTYALNMEQFSSAFCVVTEDSGLMGDISFVSHVYRISRLPIIQRDIIVSPIQIFEAKEYGSSAVCLMMSIINKQYLRSFIRQVERLNMDAVVEVTEISDIRFAVACDARIISINTEGKSFDEMEIRPLYEAIPDNILKICHTYIESFEDLKRIKAIGFNGVIISNFYNNGIGIYRELEERINEM